MAGVQTAVQLRERGWTGRVTLIGAEPHRPYDRPPLSKAVLLGTAEHSAFDLDFDALGVELLLGREVTGLRPAEHVLDTVAGPEPYGRLVLATGAEPLVLPDSAQVTGVHLLRTFDDVARLRPVLAERRSVVVVGAGWIGAEFTTAARAAGCAVTVVEAAEQPLPGALPSEITAPMRGWYERSGARLRTGVAVAALEPGAVILADGERLPADAVVVGIGARPATDWLAGSGVELCADGSVRADAGLRTTVPDVYAVGDCASFPSARYASRLLVHHWDNALSGAEVVAANILADAATDAAAEPGATGAGAEPAATGAVFDPVPYFWSDQFGRFVQYLGRYAEGDELVHRGDPLDPAWTVCWLRDGKLTALLSVDRPRDLAQARKLLPRGVPMDSELLADPEVPVKKAVRD
ncbi:NAD(P)/FAD-dependent oxidoreductase [Streptomyces oceani]|uniref:Oxidoreductase n=1 Tax=Streptomyces oceani TaxID=1075402 RepID=A0A1E7KCT5_9ACTN|nr:FAD-dependent oxidoreductase [Streptomyces oceani]OEV01739.1 oxidoreductase [Streptomyces oceani]